MLKGECGGCGGCGQTERFPRRRKVDQTNGRLSVCVDLEFR